VEEHTFFCRQCRNIFQSASQPGSHSFGKGNCPRCKSPDTIEAPAWAPLGSGQNIFEGSEWEYRCQQCLHKFKLPIPKSPSEEKVRTCPACGGSHLHRITDLGAQPLYCG
jgi:Zn finger protein HypA/HybF involved in hydrogenase expression